MAISSTLRDLRASLRARLLIAIGAILAVGAVVLSVAAWQYAATAARDAYDKLLAGGAVQIAENIYMQGGVVTLDPPAAAFATLSAYDLVFYRVTDPRGVVVAGYDDLAVTAPVSALREGVVLRDGIYRDQAVRIAAVARRLDGAPGDGWSEIVLAQTLRARDALTWDLASKAIGLIAAMSVLALVATALCLRLVFAPLTRIEAEIVQRRPDDLSPIAMTPPREVRALVGAIDGFMQRLSERITLMQRFIADATHQLRTPLAAIDAEVELLTDQTKDPKALDQLRNRLSDLARLTSQLLDHAMIQHRAQAPRFVATDINALAKSVLSQSVPLTLDREVSISFVPSEDEVVIAADAISLREALANLIHNALAHGARTRLMVSVERTAESVAIVVWDDGPGIAAEAQAGLLVPFQKGAGSHGSGLGLAIANEVAQAHGGRLRFVGNADDFSVRLELPISDQTASLSHLW
ncbi:putative two-component system histidine kinase [Bradyrhizobium oligotrophicum S58]|uniref:histidine kinase n=1 Tax=Bradyrhizobium oligotrophicum S58 TaxID=1245469 RepID=M4ZMT3_9BRAD|nr:sensor histidine kinase [Bradyrhizobium oligotrophicum]BAM87535.1 putative two-component system histidine kinase [Bradyrhizobium oligotrophicum S58]